MTRSIVAAAMLCVGTAGRLAAQHETSGRDWPMFRGADGSGAGHLSEMPDRWGSTSGLAWKVELPGPGASSPIAVGKRVFVTCYSGYGVPGQRGGAIDGLQRHVLCVSLADGSVLWRNDLPVAEKEEPRIAEHGYAGSTPASDGTRVYVFFGCSGVFAFDLGGNELWRASVGTGTHKWGSAASPVVHGNLVIVNASVESQSLVALNRLTGREAWRAEGILKGWNTPCIARAPDNSVELVIGIEGKVLGFDPGSGNELWNCGGYRNYICATPVVHDGAAYVLWGRRTMGVRLGGRGDVGRTHQLWNFWRSNVGSLVPSPVYLDGHLYFAGDRTGSVYCMDGKSGEAVYEGKLAPPPGKIYASPVLADGRIYYVSRTSGVYVVAAKPQFQQLAHHDLGDSSIFDASPAIAAGRLLLRSNRYLYCIGGPRQ